MKALCTLIIAGIVLNIGLLCNFCVAGEKIFLVSHAGAGDPFWKAEFKGAKQAASETGVELTILAPEIPNNLNRQFELLKSAIESGAAGIATTVSDMHSFSSLLKSGRKKGIPIIAFNAKPANNDCELNPYLAYIGIDDYLAGRIMGRNVLDSGRVSKHVVIANQLVGLEGLAARTKGITEVLSPQKIKVTELDVTMEPKQILQIIGNYLTEHPDVEAIISFGPAATHPIGKLIEKQGLNLYMASFDISPMTLKFIKDGLIDFTIDQQPYMQGYLAVKLLVLAARYKMRPPDINTGVGIINKSNVDKIESLVKKCIR